MKSFLFASALAMALASFAAVAADAPQPSQTQQALNEVTQEAKTQLDATAAEVIRSAKGQVQVAVTPQQKPATANAPAPQTKIEASTDTKLDARANEALKVTQQRLANMSVDEKEKLVDDLNHPDGKTVGQGMAAMGTEIGQGLGNAVKEVGTTFNDFANSGVGKIATFILVWHFFGRSFLWFIFICMLLKGLGKTLKHIFGEYDEKGKFVRLNLNLTKSLDDGVVFGIFILVAGVLGACIIGAATTF